MGFSSPENGKMFGEVGVARGVDGTPGHGHHHLAGVSRGCDSPGGWVSRYLHPLCRHRPSPRSFPEVRPRFHQASSPATSFHFLHLQPDPPDISAGSPNFGSGRREKTFPVCVSPAAAEMWPSGGGIWTTPGTGDHEQDGTL